MKYLIASDIHGSLKYCNDLVEQYKKEKKVEKTLNEERITAIILCKICNIFSLSF